MKVLKNITFIILFLILFCVTSYAIPPTIINEQFEPLLKLPMTYILSTVILIMIIVSIVVLKKRDEKYIKDIFLYILRVGIIYFCILLCMILENSTYPVNNQFLMIVIFTLIPSIVIEFIIFGIYIRIKGFINDVKNKKNNN